MKTETAEIASAGGGSSWTARLAAWLRHLRYGEPVIVVSGLPRSGTSMAMRMLEAGGVPILSDQQRRADVDNPRGYFELEKVKHLEKDSDRGWIEQARGRAVKVISDLLRSLPPGHAYRVIFMERDLGEVIASQNKMLERRGEPVGTPEQDARFAELFERRLYSTRRWLESRPNFSVLYVSYTEVLKQPEKEAARLAAFLGRPLDISAMAAAVDTSLYRNRSPEL